jgi:hypothetical protein
VNQLRMRRKSLEDLPDHQIPEGLELRTYRNGDEGGWARLMSGAIGDWDEESTVREFLGEPGVSAEGIFLLVTGDEYVATATDARTECRLAPYGGGSSPISRAATWAMHLTRCATPHDGPRLPRCRP